MASLRRSLEKLAADAPEIASETKLNEKDVEKVFAYAMVRVENNRRKPAPACPKGGISQSAASRKYGIKQVNISRWVSKGYIPVLLRTNREVYIAEDKLAEIARHYLNDPGQGKRTITQNI
ncbi:MAG: hypothetical protein JW762_13645 [Dehalococcoidales bacterium]|nr:hypothetical protein [Dehalococcoidales bacterium]